MNENMNKMYLKEEEFLDDFSNFAIEAAKILKNEWQPNYNCNDKTRQNRDYFLSTGELASLTFNSAAVYHDKKGFSSVQIVLESSNRIVTVRVKRNGSKLIAKIIADKLK